MQSSQKSLMRQLVFYSLLLAAACHLAQPITEANFFGELATGHKLAGGLRLALGSGSSTPGWVEPRWGWALLNSQADVWMQERGLIGLRLLSVLGLVFALGALMRRLTADGTFAGLLTLLTSAGILVHPEGMQLAAPIALLLLLFGQLSGELTRVRGGIALLVATVLVNFDAEIFLWAALIAGLLYAPQFPARKRKFLFAIFGAAPLLHPTAGQEISSAAALLFGGIKGAALFRLNLPTVFHYDFALFVLLGLIYSLCVHYRAKHLERGEFLATIVFTLLAGISRSYVPLALVVHALVLAALWGRVAGTGFGHLGEAIHRLGARLQSVSAVGLIWLFLCIAVVEVAKLQAAPLSKALLPQAEIDAILRVNPRPQILHAAAVGAFVNYRLAPLGARSEIRPQTLALNPLLYQRSENFFAARPGWREFAEEQAAEFILARSSDSISQVLELDRTWREVPVAAGGGQWRVFQLQSAPTN